MIHPYFEEEEREIQSYRALKERRETLAQPTNEDMQARLKRARELHFEAKKAKADG